MPLFPRVLLVGATCFVLAGLGFLFLAHVDSDPPPKKPLLSAEISNARSGDGSLPTSESLLSPWVVPVVEPVRVASSPAIATPLPKRIDRTSLIFVGSAQNDTEGKQYFFKYQPTGQVIALPIGKEKKGWLLKSVSEKAYSIVGPGGEFEVTR